MYITYQQWSNYQKDRGIDTDQALKSLGELKIELPSWGFGDSGTRFKTFPYKGAAVTLWEKLDDAAKVNELTGMCPTVAIHIPWDKVDDYTPVKAYAAQRGIAIGAVNPNLFQDEEYQFGSLTNAKPEIRNRAIAHMKECAEIMKLTDSPAMSVWMADGTNYPGQASIRSRKHWLAEGLKAAYDLLPDNTRMLIEYKVFEPAFYHTDLADWGMSLNYCQKLGDKAQVLVDIGHHAPGTNVEHIVAFLIDEGKLGGFHFNNRKYADDDLIVGSINPYELFLIFHEIISAGGEAACAECVRNIAYMIDQSHCIEPKIPAMIRSVLNVETAYAKALLVNRQELLDAQLRNDVMAAENCVRSAFEQDVTPMLTAFRESKNVPVDPMKAFAESGYYEQISGRKQGTGWG